MEKSLAALSTEYPVFNSEFGILWRLAAAWANGRMVYRLSIVRFLLGLSTLFVHYPDGLHAQIFKKSPDEAKLIFASPPPFLPK